eukprot:763513-Hanusia_phi.AAC.1
MRSGGSGLGRGARGEDEDEDEDEEEEEERGGGGGFTLGMRCFLPGSQLSDSSGWPGVHLQVVADHQKIQHVASDGLTELAEVT